MHDSANTSRRRVRRALAAARGTSPRTVANQLRSVYRKLGVASRSELRLFVAPREPWGGAEAG